MPIEQVSRLCGAKCRDGHACTQPAMPNGRCKMHGGKSTGPTPKHGFYSKRVRGELAQKLREAGEIANPLDTTEELLLDKALCAQFMDQWVEGQRVTAEMVRVVQAMTGEIVRKSSYIVKSRNDTALTAAEVTFLLASIRSVIGEYVPAERIPEFWSAIRRMMPTAQPVIDEEEDE